MAWIYPYISDTFTLYQGDTRIIRLSLALWLADDFTKKVPFGKINVKMKKGDIHIDDCDKGVKAGFLKAVKNPSGYYIFTELTQTKYSLCINSDYYFPEKRIINGIQDIILEFDNTGPAKNATETRLKDTTNLKSGDTVEFQNILYKREQRKINNIENDRTISWDKELKYDFTVKGSIIRVLRLLEFDSTGPAGNTTDVKLKDASKLKPDDIVEFQNPRGDIEQRKVIDIENKHTIVWYKKLKYDFSVTGSTIRVLNYIIDEIPLKPRPTYPFPDHAILVRGSIYDSDNEPVSNAKVEVEDQIETKSDKNGEFVLYFKKIAPPVQIKINDIIQPSEISLEKGRAVNLGKIIFS